jgi:hypothetical protein
MDFDMSGMNKAFDRMRENASRQGKDLAKVQADDFLKSLRMEGKAIAPTPDRIFTDVKNAGFKIYRKPGKSVQQEIQRRIRARGTFGRAWQIVKITSEKFAIRVWMINKSGESAKVDAKKGVSDKAEKISGNRFKSRLNRLADSIMGQF